MHVFDTGGMRILSFESNRQPLMCLADPYDTDIECVGYMHLPLAVAPRTTRAHDRPRRGLDCQAHAARLPVAVD